MPHYSENRCGVCGQLTDRLRLFVKRVTFAELSRPNKVIRSRTKMWICNTCLVKDADWNQEAFAGPGHTSPGLENARQIRGEPK